MNIKPHHLSAVQTLVAEQFEDQTQEKLAAKIGIEKRTLYRWMHDPAFLAVLAETQAEWRAQIDHIPYIHRRKRLEELMEIYEGLPADYIDKIIHDVVAPNPVTGEMVSQSLPVRKSNALARAKILEQIALEVGGDVAAELAALKIKLGMADGKPVLRVASDG